MKTVLFTLVLAFVASTCQAQTYYLRDRYGYSARVQAQRNCIRQYDRIGRPYQSYRIQGNRIQQYNRYGQVGKNK